LGRSFFFFRRQVEGSQKSKQDPFVKSSINPAVMLSNFIKKKEYIYQRRKDSRKTKATLAKLASLKVLTDSKKKKNTKSKTKRSL
jgi:hypothetical protein